MYACKGWIALGEADHAQQRRRLVEDAQLLEEHALALGVAVEGDVAGEDLFGQQVELLADAVVDGLEDAGLQGLPGVAGQQRRDVGLVELGRASARGDFSMRASGSTS